MADAPNLLTNNRDETKSNAGVHAGLHNDANREINRLHGVVADLVRTRQFALIAGGMLAAGAQAVGTIPVAVGYRVYAVTFNAPGRVRLYTTVAKRNADLDRAVTTPVPTNSGLVLDYVASAAGTFELSPLVDGFQNEAAPSSAVPYIISNNTAVAASIDVTLTYVRTE